MRANTTYIGRNNLQNAMFPLEYMYITQGENGGYSHQGTYAIDFAGYGPNGSINRCPYYAPCDLELVAIADASNHGYAYTSRNMVNFIDGTSGYLTILVAHDDDVYYTTRIVNQGDLLGHTGTYGNVTGDHVHMEVKKGQYEGLVRNSDGVYMLKNSTHIYDLLGVNDTFMIRDLGYNWRVFDGPTPYNIKKNRFPWVLYAQKLRNMNI